MPLWDLDELLRARELVYPDVSEETVRELYLTWGGVVRCASATRLHAHSKLLWYSVRMSQSSGASDVPPCGMPQGVDLAAAIATPQGALPRDCCIPAEPVRPTLQKFPDMPQKLHTTDMMRRALCVCVCDDYIDQVVHDRCRRNRMAVSVIRQDAKHGRRATL